MAEYRILEVNNDGYTKFYPQVKVVYFWLFSRWLKIGKHPDGYGLYDNFNYGHNTYFEALEIIEGYKKHLDFEENFQKYCKAHKV